MAKRAAKEETKLLMPMASAVWLIDNTGLTFGQIADFTGMSGIEIEALADGDIGKGLVGRNPLDHNELTKEELARCEADSEASLVLNVSSLPPVKSRAKGPRYTPVSKRGDKPDAIAYILKNNPEISDAQICKLVGTTKPTINNIRDRTHPNTPNLRPRHPADLDLCSYTEFEKAVDKGLKAQGKDPEAIRAQRLSEQQAGLSESTKADDNASESGSGGFDFSNFLGTPSPSTSSDKNDDENNAF
ncbi:MAG: cell cycle transcriptional regulator TrcR [Bdellovibrionales bacterium]